MNGKTIKDYGFELDNGVNRIHINVNDLDAGLYMLRTSNNHGIQRNMKFIVPYYFI